MDKKKLRALVNHLKGRLKGLCCRLIAYEAPDYFEAVEVPGRPVPCPMHPDDRVYFVFDKDGNDTGAGHCPKCGVYSDVIDFLMKVNNLDFFEALDAIQDWLERYERSIRTGIPDTVTDPIYMRIPEIPVVRYAPKINRFTEARRKLEAEQQTGSQPPRVRLAVPVPVEVKPSEFGKKRGDQ